MNHIVHPAPERGPLSYCQKVGISTLPAIFDLENAVTEYRYSGLTFDDVCRELRVLDACEDFTDAMHLDYLNLTFLKEEMFEELLRVQV